MGWWKNMKARRQKKKHKEEDTKEEYIDISPAPEKTPASPPGPTKKRGWLSRWSPGARRDRQIAWLQAGYSEMLTLMRGINDHLGRQEDVQVKMTEVLGKLPDSMASLQNVGKAAEQQVEVLALLREQLDNSANHDQKLVESMDKFNHTLGVMDETSRTSGKTVAELIQRSQNADSMLREVIERSERRFVLLTVLFLLAVILGVGAVLYSSSHPVVTVKTSQPAMVEDTETPTAVQANRPPKAIAREQKEIDKAQPTLVTGETPAVETEEDEQPRTLFQRLFRRKPRPEPEEPPAE